MESKIVAKKPKSKGSKKSKKKGDNVQKQLNDIKKYLKAVKPEKKFVTTYINNDSVGQCNQDIAGYFAAFIHPDLPQNMTENGRIGARVNWTSAYFKFQFFTQGACTQGIKLRFEIWRLPRPSGSAPGEVDAIYDPNPFISGGSGPIIDYHSQRNEDYLTLYKKIYETTAYIPPDTMTPASGTQPQVVYKDIKLKFKKPIVMTYEGTGTGGVTDGAHILVIFANCGNKNTSNPSTLATLPLIAPNTGAVMNYTHRNYYTDN